MVEAEKTSWIATFVRGKQVGSDQLMQDPEIGKQLVTSALIKFHLLVDPSAKCVP